MNKTWTLAPALSYSALNLPYEKKEDLKKHYQSIADLYKPSDYVSVCVCVSI